MATVTPIDIMRSARTPLASSPEPLRLAECFRRTYFEINGHPTLVRWARAWWRFEGTRYVELDDESLMREVYRFLDVVEYEERDDKGEQKRKRVTARTKTAQEVIKAMLRAFPMLGPNMPQWTATDPDDPSQFVACQNGILNLKTLELTKPTPRLFVTTAIGTDWIPSAPEPQEWIAFLKTIWGEDKESIRALQQMFGYFLTSDTSQQKLFALVGPKRSGKGTIARILKTLLGEDSVVNPTLGSLERPFGLAPLVGKRLAVIGDARLGGRADQAAVIERLLSISGEDALSIDRKNRDPINVRLATRVMLLTNEVPKLYDASGALASRFLILTMTRSFLGSEDTGLEQRLTSELPGILKWAIEGRQDLAESGRFIQPLSSERTMADLEAISSPVSVFLDERCRLDPHHQVEISELYTAWKKWCEDNGREPGNKQVFCRDVRSVATGVYDRQTTIGGRRTRVYEGLGIL